MVQALARVQGQGSVTDVPTCTGYADAMKTIETWDTNLREYEIVNKQVLAEFAECVALKRHVAT